MCKCIIRVFSLAVLKFLKCTDDGGSSKLKLIAHLLYHMSFLWPTCQPQSVGSLAKLQVGALCRESRMKIVAESYSDNRNARI